jgi:LemA protein
MVIAIIITASTAILAALIFFAFSYKRFKKMQKDVEQAQKGIEENLKKRYEIIPKLVEKGRIHVDEDHDKLDDIVEAGNRVVSAVGIEEMALTEENLYESVDGLFEIEDNNHNLKTDAEFSELKKEYMKIEENLLNSRIRFNRHVKALNSLAENFPGNLIARLSGFKRRECCRIKNDRIK